MTSPPDNSLERTRQRAARASLRRFLFYLAGKRSEVQDLDLKDIVMAKAILDIHRKRTRKEFALIPLHSIHPIHRLDRENALQATQQRAATLRQHKQDLLNSRQITRESLARLMPSVSWIKVVQSKPDEYLAFEGNGRLAAMKEVFEPSDKIVVEVEQYYFRNSRPILRRLSRVRRMNGLTDEV